MVEEPGEEPRRRRHLLRLRKVVGRHLGDRPRGAEAPAGVHAAGEQHAGEDEEVVDGRDQAGCARREHRRRGVCALRAVAVHAHLLPARIGEDRGVRHFVAIFGKREKSDPSRAERQALAALVRQLKEEP